MAVDYAYMWQCSLVLDSVPATSLPYSFQSHLLLLVVQFSFHSAVSLFILYFLLFFLYSHLYILSNLGWNFWNSISFESSKHFHFIFWILLNLTQRLFDHPNHLYDGLLLKFWQLISHWICYYQNEIQDYMLQLKWPSSRWGNYE